MKNISMLCFLTGFVFLLTAIPPSQPLADDRGDAKGGREFTLEVVVNAPPAEVFSLWTDSQKAKTFLASDSRIEPRAGGRYEVMYDPDTDPDGATAGTKGSRILRYEPPTLLVFEWNSHNPNWPETTKNPQLTWVEVRFGPASGDPAKTLVRIRHYGFREGGIWDDSLAYYRDQGWPWVTKRLRGLYREVAKDGSRRFAI